jgi:hypothetical protein
MRILLISSVLIFSLAGTPPLQVESSPDWQPLFDGQGLTGWEIVGGGIWTVEDSSPHFSKAFQKGQPYMV